MKSRTPLSKVLLVLLVFISTFSKCADIPTQAVKNRSEKVLDVLQKPQIYRTGDSSSVLFVCHGNASGPSHSLRVECKHMDKIKRRASLEYLTSYDKNIPSMSTSRLLIQRKRFSEKHLAVSCWCRTCYSGKKSTIVHLGMQPFRENIRSPFFLSKKNRKLKVTINSSAKLSWHYLNKPNMTLLPQCYHDGKSLEKPHILLKKSRIVIYVHNVSDYHTGFYWCDYNGTSCSSFMKLQVQHTDNGWSKWYTWFNCSAKCGYGKMIEARKCLKERQQCDGPSVRVNSCVVPCTSNDIITRTMLSTVKGVSTKMATLATTNTTVSNDTVKAGHGLPTMDVSDSIVILIIPIASICVLICLLATIVLTKKYKSSKMAPIPIAIKESDKLISEKLDIHLSKMSYRQLDKICCCLENADLRSHWPYLASRTGFDRTHIHALLEMSPYKRAEQFLDIWMSKEPHVKVSDLLKVLKDIGRLDLVEVIKKDILNVNQFKEAPKNDVFVEGHYREGPVCSKAHLNYASNGADDYYNISFCNISRKATKIHRKDPIHYNMMRKYSCSNEEDSCSDYPMVDIVEEGQLNRQDSSKSKTSNVSNLTSVSKQHCPKPRLPDTINSDLCAWGIFTEKGGILKIKDTGVSLYIPEMALPKGTSQLVYIGLMSKKGFYPKMGEGQTVLSPVVICGPDGLQFNKPLCLTVPHNAVIDDFPSLNAQVQSCSAVPQSKDEIKQWKLLEKDNEPPFSYVDRSSMQIMIKHFTGFCVIGQPQEIQKWVVPYCTEPKVDLDCSVRIYCIPTTKAALEELGVEERKLNGSQKDSRKRLIISNNNKDILVNMEKVKDGWSVDDREQTIPFRDVWQTQHSDVSNCFPNVTFIFERRLENQFSFSSSFNVKQDHDNGASVKVKVVCDVKRLTSTSSGYSSYTDLSGFQSEMPSKISFEIHRKLCHLLDVARPDFHDYRLLAEELGFEKSYIKWLQCDKCKHPTNEILRNWESMRPDEPLEKLIEILEKMERHDAADLLKTNA